MRYVEHAEHRADRHQHHNGPYDRDPGYRVQGIERLGSKSHVAPQHGIRRELACRSFDIGQIERRLFLDGMTWIKNRQPVSPRGPSGFVGRARPRSRAQSCARPRPYFISLFRVS
jgi:hypothetical protein